VLGSSHMPNSKQKLPRYPRIITLDRAAGPDSFAVAERHRGHRAATSNATLTSQPSTIDLDSNLSDYGSPSTARVLVRNSMECPDVVRKTEVEEGMSC